MNNFQNHQAFLFLILFLNIIKLDCNGALIHRYPLQNSLENSIDKNKPATKALTDFTLSYMDDRTGATTNAMQLQDSVNFFLIPTSTVQGLTDFTFSIWAYSEVETAAARNPCIFTTISGSDTNVFYFCRYNQRLYSFYKVNSQTFKYKEWFHYTVVRDSSAGKLTIYHDGVVIDDSTGVPGAALNISKFRLANYKNLRTIEQFVGGLQDFQIHNSANSISQVQDIMNKESCNVKQFLNTLVSPHTCNSCVSGCFKCDSSSTCIECLNTINRKTDNSCDCLDTFYNDASDNCVSCNPPCLNCSSSSICTSCNGNFRKNDASCLCQDGYYDDGVSNDCQTCPNIYKVKRCSSTTGTTIDECKPGTERSLDTSSGCGCNQGYYDDGSNITCLQCPSPYKYLDCTDTSTITFCTPGNQRTLDTTTGCGCTVGFYDDNSNSDCVQCPNSYKVKSCTDNTNITECKSGLGSERTLDTTTGCGCNIGFYDDGVNLDCVQCPNSYKVDACTSASTISQCKAGNERTLNTSTGCGCNTGFYDDGSNVDCIQCLNSYRVQDCSARNIITQCKAGVERNMDTRNCGCNEGYYDNGSDIDCIQCNNAYKVKNCTSNMNISECKNGFQRNLDPSTGCGCNQGFYDDGVNINCKPCQYPCINCSSATVCIGTCSTIENRNSAPSCSCQDGFFENGSVCEECDHSICATCINSGDECLISCPKNCDLCNSSQQCLQVEAGYFKDSITSEIKKCDRSCSTCENQAKQCINVCEYPCVQCNPDGSCKSCSISMYLSSQNTCFNCPSKCLSCQEENICISCHDSGVGRSFSLDNNCGCLDGYYESSSSHSLDCLKCPVKNCLKCNNDGICLQCSNSELLPPDCQYSSSGKLLKETSENGNYETGICSIQCSSCLNFADQCTTCSLGLNRNFESPCFCKPGYHDNQGSTKDCYRCPRECDLCVSSLQCTRCKRNRKLNKYSSICECENGFKLNEFSGECQQCYLFQGNCLIECPFNTVANKFKYICEKKNYYIQDMIPLIWLGCFIIVLIFLLVILVGIVWKKVNGIDQQQQIRNSNTGKNKIQNTLI